MAILRESPWYTEILQEGFVQGIEQGIEQGDAQMLLVILRHRFGDLPPDLEQRIHRLPAASLQQLASDALDAPDLPALVAVLAALEAEKPENPTT